MSQRKVCKLIVDRILNPAMYEVISEREEKICLSKLKDKVKELKLSEGQLEVAFGLYDLDEQGIITIDDLREGITSLELYTDPVKDRKIFLALGLKLLNLS
jgi:Ca2+-binding EF-hand superfamily protein